MTTAQHPRRGDVFDINLDPIAGAEIGKRRPAIVVSNDINNEYAQTVTVVPLTGQSAGRNYPFEVAIPSGVAGLTTSSIAKCNQVRTVDKRRLVNLRGSLPENYLDLLDQAMRVHLSIE